MIDRLNTEFNTRFYKPNDPYYYEVDNLPLIDLLLHSETLRAKVNEIISNTYTKTEVDNKLANRYTYNLVDIEGTDNTNRIDGDVLAWDSTISPPAFKPIQKISYTYGLYDVKDYNGNNHNLPNHVLVWDGSEYEQRPLEIEDLYNVTAPTTPIGSRSIIEQRTLNTGGAGTAVYDHKLSDSFTASQIIMFSEFGIAPLTLSSPYNLNSTDVANHAGGSTLPHLTHYIVEAQGNTDNSSHAYVKVADGLYSTSRHILKAVGTGSSGADTWNTNQATLAAESPNTNDITFLVSGWTNIYVKVVGWVETRSFRAIMD